MKIALYGSGEFTDAVNDIDRHLIDTYHLRSVAVIPTAAGQEPDNAKWIDMATRHFAPLGLRVIPVPVLDQAQADDASMAALIAQADWIFFSGGDPDYLLSVLQDSLLWQTVQEKVAAGALLAGSSAGAMVMGSFMLANPSSVLFFGEEPLWKPGFGLIDHAILPHFNAMKTRRDALAHMLESTPDNIKSDWIGIDENTALILDDGNQQIVGAGDVTGAA